MSCRVRPPSASEENIVTREESIQNDMGEKQRFCYKGDSLPHPPPPPLPKQCPIGSRKMIQNIPFFSWGSLLMSSEDQTGASQGVSHRGDDNHEVGWDAGDPVEEVRSELGQVAFRKFTRRENLQYIGRLQGEGGVNKNLLEKKTLWYPTFSVKSKN